MQSLPTEMRISLHCLALLLCGCLSGQTGSPLCATPTSCMCHPMLNESGVGGFPGLLESAPAQLRVHVESADTQELVATVDEELHNVLFNLNIGERIAGRLVAQKPCDEWGATPPPPAAGSELFVIYRPGQSGGFPDCDARHACSQQQCAHLLDAERWACVDRCTTETQPTCDGQRAAAILDGTFSYAVPWSDPLEFGGGKRLALSELELLRSADTCLERFPIEPAPCDDTIEGCSIHQPARASWAPWLAALTLAAIRFRRRRKP